jgi:hypothetical protein
MTELQYLNEVHGALCMLVNLARAEVAVSPHLEVSFRALRKLEAATRRRIKTLKGEPEEATEWPTLDSTS